MPVFKPNHQYFEEALEYQILLVGLAATMPLQTAHKNITDLVDVINRLTKDRTLRVSGNITMPVLPSKFQLAHGRQSDIISIYNCHDTFGFITGQLAKPRAIRFSVKKNRLNPDVPDDKRQAAGTLRPEFGQVRDVGSDLMSTIVLITANLIGGAYEKSQSLMESVHTRNPSSWPPELQFFRHLRNACFHGNHFNIRRKRDGTDTIDPAAPPKWHLYTMPNDVAVNGQQAVGGFFPHNQVLPFLYQIGNIVRT